MFSSKVIITLAVKVNHVTRCSQWECESGYCTSKGFPQYPFHPLSPGFSSNRLYIPETGFYPPLGALIFNFICG